jgi:hypothetical protein
VPDAVAAGARSPAFSRFLWHWFGDIRAVGRGELDVGFLKELTPEELSLARELIRRNLKIKHVHIIEAAGLLRDPDAVPILREMLSAEPDLSWRLTIAGSLWKINRDPAFIQCLEEAKSAKPEMFQWVHLLQVLWLEDERAVDFLVDLLDQKDTTGRWFVLGLLNQLEFGRRFDVPAVRMPHQPADYQKVRGDPTFRARMVAEMRKRNAESINGR